MTTIEARKLTISRIINAPVEKVYQACVDEKALAQWFGCEQTKVLQVDVETKVGGKRNITAEKLDDHRMVELTGQYLEIVPNQLLKFTWHSPGFEIPCPDMVVTMTFKAIGNTTELTILQENIPAEVIEGFDTGWSHSLDKLEQHIQR